jgi:hypothetical protein
MNKTFLWRLVLDGTAAGLLLVALAYYWLDNTAHELAGTGVFLLLVVHNVFNRRWYGAMARPQRAARSRIDRVLTLCLLAAMLVLLVTSLMISHSVFSFLQAGGGYTARQAHTFAAYWSLALVAIHLGIRWERVMSVARNTFNITAKSRARTLVLRLIAAAIAAHGLYSSAVMGLGTKLALQMSLDGWDFEASAFGFFLHWLSIVGLYAVLSHHILGWATKKNPRPVFANEAKNRAV